MANKKTSRPALHIVPTPKTRRKRDAIDEWNEEFGAPIGASIVRWRPGTVGTIPTARDDRAASVALAAARSAIDPTARPVMAHLSGQLWSHDGHSTDDVSIEQIAGGLRAFLEKKHGGIRSDRPAGLVHVLRLLALAEHWRDVNAKALEKAGLTARDALDSRDPGAMFNAAASHRACVEAVRVELAAMSSTAKEAERRAIADKIAWQFFRIHDTNAWERDRCEAVALAVLPMLEDGDPSAEKIVRACEKAAGLGEKRRRKNP